MCRSNQKSELKTSPHHIKKTGNLFTCLLLAIMFITLHSCRLQKLPEISKRPAIDSSRVVIKLQQRKDYGFDNGRLYFSNRFAGARLNNVTGVNDSTFTITIEPENTPVNPSPWYAFKIWSTTNRNLHITIHYAQSKHRYDPKMSHNGVSWIDIQDVGVKEDSSEIFFRLAVSRDTVTVAAQELVSSASAYAWMDSLSHLPFFRSQVIGHSIMGKPIVALNTTGSAGTNIIVVLCRQHPPEVTGYMAMQEFVRTIASSTDLAGNFRRYYELILFPLLNPDGVDEGTWRHSAAGVDLNRDWELFNQPETNAIKNFLAEIIRKQQAKVYFGIDFHSTWSDVFYTNADTNTNWPGLTNQWLKEFEKAIPGFEADVRPSGHEGNVSKSWMMRALGTDALTYEVGDKTPVELLKIKGRVAAEKLMELLLPGEKK